MFECPRCRGLGLSPACVVCPPGGDEDLVFAEEVVEEPLSFAPGVDLEDEDFDLDLGDDSDLEDADSDLDGRDGD
jgi:hypothetical protein